ncbi:hypothetical protein EYF80_068260 [Liparis tanakae]|uniref:Uncharacterized protein n=1 Tax=Liparis tanakae TaxID=230148 RepID=A0A4Z2DYW0_9TELE|nr:hypothetical protein EYF80_068260 [Liparis tanakae]
METAAAPPHYILMTLEIRAPPPRGYHGDCSSSTTLHPHDIREGTGLGSEPRPPEATMETGGLARSADFCLV